MPSRCSIWPANYLSKCRHQTQIKQVKRTWSNLCFPVSESLNTTYIKPVSCSGTAHTLMHSPKPTILCKELLPLPLRLISQFSFLAWICLNNIELIQPPPCQQACRSALIWRSLELQHRRNSVFWGENLGLEATLDKAIWFNLSSPLWTNVEGDKSYHSI